MLLFIISLLNPVVAQALALRSTKVSIIHLVCLTFCGLVGLVFLLVCCH